MVSTLSRVDHPAAQGKQFVADDLVDGKTVDADRFVTVAEVQGSKSNAYGAGAGPQDERSNTDGWSDLDLQLVDGGGANHPAQGRFRYEVYRDENKEDLIAKSRTFPAAAVRAAVTSDLRQKILIAAMLEEMAGDDAYLTLAYRATTSGDGQSDETGWDIDASASASELGMAYSEL